MSPAASKSQQHLAGMELDRKRKGKKPVSDMGASLSTAQLTDFAATPTAKLPKTVKKAVKKGK